MCSKNIFLECVGKIPKICSILRSGVPLLCAQISSVIKNTGYEESKGSKGRLGCPGGSGAETRTPHLGIKKVEGRITKCPS
jgi:hypothetical protein